MSVEESIHAALTISRTINNHVDSLRKSANNLKAQREQIARLAGGSQSGDTAVRLLESASNTLEKTVSSLSDTSSDLESYANKIRQS